MEIIKDRTKAKIRLKTTDAVVSWLGIDATLTKFSNIDLRLFSLSPNFLLGIFLAAEGGSPVGGLIWRIIVIIEPGHNLP